MNLQIQYRMPRTARGGERYTPREVNLLVVAMFMTCHFLLAKLLRHNQQFLNPRKRR